MSTKKKMLQAAAGNAGGGLNVEEVFSTYLYTGDSSTQTITNGIDLDGEGGLVWGRRRNGTQDHFFFDTERGISNYLESNTADAQRNDNNTGVVAFNTNGFNIKSYSGQFNLSGGYYVSWTWRKAPKFFDCIQYTGDGVAGREIAHSLDANVGFMVVKRVDAINNWVAWHRLATSGSSSGSLLFNSTGATYASTTTQYYFGDGSTTIDPTSSVFTVGSNAVVNASGGTYIAYLFAHNDGDGEFGPDGDADIIKCGSYSNTGNVDVGFEPQWLIIKRASGNGEWFVFDNMRGVFAGNRAAFDLNPNSTNAEAANTDVIEFTSTGFKIKSGGTAFGNGDYIYIAIRRGPMAVPESADEVFDVSEVNAGFTTKVDVGFPVDALIATAPGQTSNRQVTDRLRGVRTNLSTSQSLFYANYDFVEQIDNNSSLWWDQTGFHIPGEWANLNTVFFSWRRAPNFFDMVTYEGNSTIRTISHNLGVAPEMMWMKSRTSLNDWTVYHKDLGAVKRLQLNNTTPEVNESTAFNSTAPTASVFTVGTSDNTNENPQDHIAYLFASLDGISKVGSYTGDGTTGRVIDCGFTSGARFVMTKRTNTTGEWNVWDTERGIVAGNDFRLELGSNLSQDPGHDYIDPHNSGFIVNYVADDNDDTNADGDNYIFYAIA